MQLHKPIADLLQQLEDSVEQLTDQQYSSPVAVLSGTSIGQHLRHVVEFFSELIKGYETGSVNYDLRQRNHRIEADRQFAIQQLQDAGRTLERRDKPLLLTASFHSNEISSVQFTTNYYRELLYNLEHTVHHMALIRIGIESVSGTKLPVQFGVADSTLQFRKVCAQ